MTTRKTTSAKLAQSLTKVANSQAAAAAPKAKKPVTRKPRATEETSASKVPKTIDATPTRSSTFQSISRIWPD